TPTRYRAPVMKLKHVFKSRMSAVMTAALAAVVSGGLLIVGTAGATTDSVYQLPEVEYAAPKASGGVADYAEASNTANTANHADRADKADKAVRADSANRADYAEQAGFATESANEKLDGSIKSKLVHWHKHKRPPKRNSAEQVCWIGGM